MDNINYCQHCYPAKANHFVNKTASIIDFYLSKPLSFLLNPIYPHTLARQSWKGIKYAIISLYAKMNYIKLSNQIDRSQLYNGSLIFWDEAIRRGLPIYNLKVQAGAINRHTEHYCVAINGKKHYYNSNPIFLLSNKYGYTDAARLDDKESLRRILMKHHLPCPLGSAFVSKKRAIEYGKKLGFPLIVKPSFSSLSCHVSLNIKSLPELEKAIDIAKQINHKIIVEQYVRGDVYRALIVDNSLIACNKRTPGKIIGNGKLTVEELISEKNKQPYRGEPGQKNYTLFKVKITKQLEGFLKEQGVKLKTKLEKGRQIFLSKKMNVGNGADISNETERVHPENKKLLEQVHRTLNLALSGLDFICKDVSIPWQEQPFAIIESNSLPGVSQHHYPSEGEPINAAEKIWDFVLKTLQGSKPSPSPTEKHCGRGDKAKNSLFPAQA